jgi:hypothetical protein
MIPETLWDRIKQGILEGASSAAETAGYLGRLGKARLEIASARHAIHEAFAELGGVVYASLEEGPGGDLAGSAEVREQVAEIKALEAELQVFEARLESLKSSEEPVTRDETVQPETNSAREDS